MKKSQEESRLSPTQKMYTGISLWNSLIFWLHFADILDQIPDCCLVFFCMINCQDIFDCRFFSFTLIKLSIYNQDYHFRFIDNLHLIPFQDVMTRKHTTAYWFRKKGSLFVSMNHNTFEELEWTIDDWNWYQILTVLKCNVNPFRQLHEDWDTGTNGVRIECWPSTETKTKTQGPKRRVQSERVVIRIHLGKIWTPLKSTTTVFLSWWLWNLLTHDGWYAIKQRIQTRVTEIISYVDNY